MKINNNIEDEFFSDELLEYYENLNTQNIIRIADDLNIQQLLEILIHILKKYK